MPSVFLEKPESEWVASNGLAFAIRDGFPVSKGHTLVVTRRIVSTWFEASRDEQMAMLDLIDIVKRQLDREFQPDGYNVGFNSGTAAGQTVMHLHVHVIPRYQGDLPDPRGGIRHVIPSLGNYLAETPNQERLRSLEVRDSESSLAEQSAKRVFGSEDQPLLPTLAADLSKATRLDLAVAFIFRSGLDRLRPYLIDLIERNGIVRILTGDYLDATEPEALSMLLDLKEIDPERVLLKVFETGGQIGFHPKTYLVSGGSGESSAYVGSSNVSKTALLHGIEWNYRFASSREPSAIATLRREFDTLYNHPRTVTLDADWVAGYLARRSQPQPRQREEPVAYDPGRDAPPELPEPHEIQLDALAALHACREAGHRAGLVVMATGLGKTWLAAFDSVPFKRVLFVAHREEILRQSLATFRQMRPQARLGLFTGSEKDESADVVFASIMTLGKAKHLGSFSPDHFDYVVIDEFHHASAPTYLRLIDHFEPTFLLGLTATPERTDGGDLLALCGENLVYRADVAEGIIHGLLSPFHYYGIPDPVDYRNIPWRNGRFDPDELEMRVATETRARNALEEWQKRKGSRTLAFCVSRRHANYMAEFFRANSIRTAAIHSGSESAPRVQTMDRLRDGDLDIVFSVDMFNEGVDLPTIDTILMLRPTESKILWLQQFGRGLRKADEKDHLTVVDYIGNHRTFLNAARAILPGAGETLGTLTLALARVAENTLELPPGCFVRYELEALDILNRLATPPKGASALAAWYAAYLEETGVRPSASEAWHAGFDPKSVRGAFGSWLEFVAAQGGLGTEQHHSLRQHTSFFRSLEVTPMTKSYKMVLLLAMIAEDRFPGQIDIDVLVDAFRHQARRSIYLEQDVGSALMEHEALRRLLEQNPIEAWVGAKGMGGTDYFVFDGTLFSTNTVLLSRYREETAVLAREVCEWRIAEYIARLADDQHLPEVIRCKVSHSNAQPILFLPQRDKFPGIPNGWTRVIADGVYYSANFVKIAVNVMHKEDETINRLPEILRGWFGTDAGQPGNLNQVVFRRDAGVYRMEPASLRMNGPELWREYQRPEIPPLFGLDFSEAIWNQGFVRIGKLMFLLVSLEKDGLAANFKFHDRFTSGSSFQWQTQNRTARTSKVAESIKTHAHNGISVHLFVRKGRKLPNGNGAPFTYCGDLVFRDWSGDRPITIDWDLRIPLPRHVAIRLGVDPLPSD